MENELCRLSNFNDIKIIVKPIFLFVNSMQENYNCADILVRLLAIDCYYGKNSDGFTIYNEMQYKRVIKNPNVPNEKAYNEKNFIELIKSFENNKFDFQYPLQVNKDIEILDGAHRLALALYHHIDYVPIYFSECRLDRKIDYSLEWFKKEGMEKYIPQIIEKYNNLIKEYEEDYILIIDIEDFKYNKIKSDLLNNLDASIKYEYVWDKKCFNKSQSLKNIWEKSVIEKLHVLYIKNNYKIGFVDIVNDKTNIISKELESYNISYKIIKNRKDIEYILKIGEYFYE